MGRAIDIPMPKLGLTMSEGTIAEWLVQPGQSVAAGQPIAVIETDKIANEVEAPATGMFERLFAEGAVVEVGVVIARLSTDGEGAAEATVSSLPPAIDPRPAPPPQEPERTTAKENTASDTAIGQSPGARTIATPYARKLAREAGIEIDTIRLPAGEPRIIAEDVEKLIAASDAIARTAHDGRQHAAADAVQLPQAIGITIIQKRLNILPLIKLLEQLRHPRNPEKRFDIGQAVAFAAARVLGEREELGIVAGQRPARIAIQTGFAAPHGSMMLDRVSGLAMSAFVTLIEGPATNDQGRGPELLVRDLSAAGNMLSATTAGLLDSATLSIGCEETFFVPDDNGNPKIEIMATVILSSSSMTSESILFEFMSEISGYLEEPFLLFS